MTQNNILELAELCSSIRDFLDDVPSPEENILDNKVEEMLETMQSAWEEATQILDRYVY